MGIEGGVDLSVEVLGSYVCERTPETLPIGSSPFNQDCQYTPGGVGTRPGVSQVIPNSAPDTYIKTFVDEQGNNHTLFLDTNGDLWDEFPQGTVNLISGGIIPGSLCNSVTAFGREYMAFSDGKFGTDIPRAYDGTNFDRVSQIGPGQAPTVTDFLPAVATLATPGGGSSATITSTGVLTTDPKSYVVPAYPPYFNGGTYTVFTTVTFTTTAPHGFAVGNTVNTSSVTNSVFDFTGATIIAVPSTTTFKVAFNYSTLTTSGNGTATVPNPSAVLFNNIATINTSAAHGFLPGWTVTIGGMGNIAIGSGISAISQANGIVTVTMNAAHGLPVGASVIVAGVSDTTYNGVFLVSEVPTPLIFQYIQTTTNATSTGGTVSFTFNGVFIIASTPTPTTFTYSVLGPNIQSAVAGSATVTGNVVPGLHQISVMFQTRNGYITKPAPPNTFNASGGKLVSVTNIPTGPTNIIARYLIFTPLIGASQQGQTSGSFFAILPNMRIADNVTTSVVIDFSDSNLIAGEDFTESFNLLELGECAGVTQYASRLFWWGERAKLNNLLNLTFDGGWGLTPPPTFGPNQAGTGTDTGGPNAWTNPGNIGSSSLTSTISLSASGGSLVTSNPLDAQTFNLVAAAGTPITGIQVNVNCTVASIVGAPTIFIEAQLLKAGSPVGTLKSVNISGAGGTIVFSPNDLWGSTFLGSDVDAATFGVQLRVAIRKTTHISFSAAFTLNNCQITVMQPSSQFPLGWNLDPVNGPGLTENRTNSVFGSAAQFTGNGTATVGEITQSAYQDYLGVSIIGINTAYSVRVRLLANGLTSGTFQINLFSPTQGLLGAGLSVPYTACNSSQFLEFIQPLCAAQTSIPTDLQLVALVSGTPTLNGYFLADDIEVFPTLQPYNASLDRASFADLPDAYDAITGQIQVNPTDGQRIASNGVIRSTLYIAKGPIGSFWSVATDNTNEPSLWPVQIVSASVGSVSVHSMGTFEGESGEDWILLLDRNGLFLYDSGEPDKLTQEIQLNTTSTVRPSWNSINWLCGHTSWLTVDIQNRRLFIGVPMFGATTPNIILQMDFKPLGSSTGIEEGSPVYVSAYTGRILSKETQRKWSPWSIAAHCGAMVERSDGTAQFMFGITSAENYPSTSFPIPSGYSLAASVDGGAYALIETQFYDALVIGGNTVNYPIYAYYMTAYLPDAGKRLELQQILTAPIVLFNYLVYFAEGSGDLNIFTLTPGNNVVQQLPIVGAPPFALSNPATSDMEAWVNTRGYRVAFLCTATFPPLNGTTLQNVGSWFELRKFVPSVKNDPASPYRGMI
jgi:hypothetical protein